MPGPRDVTPLYAPALVAWVGRWKGKLGFSVSFSSGNAAAVGWFPLGPREPYIPSYRVSSSYFGRVNTSNTVVNNTPSTITTTSAEAPTRRRSTTSNMRTETFRTAVTAVPQDRFSNGRRVAESAHVVSAAQLGAARFVAAPAIAPQRVSVLGPKAGEASRAPRPPAAVISRRVVARTAPPPAPIPFERQQAVLNQNPAARFQSLQFSNWLGLRQPGVLRFTLRIWPRSDAFSRQSVRDHNRVRTGRMPLLPNLVPPGPQPANIPNRAPAPAPATAGRPNASQTNATARQDGLADGP